MRRLVGTILLWLSAAYAVAGVITFTQFFMPFAGIKQLHVTAACAVLVLVPYLVLHSASRRAATRTSEVVVLIAIVVAAAIGGFLYAGSFGYNDGEYIVAYILTPIAQAPFALVAWMVAYWSCRARAA
jgi:hypothetical protein